MKNIIIGDDNLVGMSSLEPGSINLCLWSPPFNCGPMVQGYPSRAGKHWIAFMRPRIQIAQQLLKPGGYLVVHISIRHLWDLGHLMWEIFGNRFDLVMWKINQKQTEFVLVAANAVAQVFSSPAAMLTSAELDHPRNGTKLLLDIVGKGLDGYPTIMPLKFAEFFITRYCDNTGTVLDAFSGSGTTGHAVLSLNHKSGSDRTFVMIDIDATALKISYDRIRRVISGDWVTGKTTPLGGECELLDNPSKDASYLIPFIR